MEFRLVTQLLYLFVFSAVMLLGTVRAQQGFNVTPVDTIATPASSVVLNCEPADPLAFARWAIGNPPLMFSDETCSGCVQLTNFSLYIPSVNQGHAGQYTCFILGQGSSISTVTLTVAEPPRIQSVSDTDITFNQNDTVSINVIVTGVPQPNATWFKDNTNISTKPRVSYNDFNLNVATAEHTDAGVYQIKAQNLADIVATSFNVFIRFLPVITISRNPDDDSVAEGTTVTVMCSAMSHPQSTINWLQVTPSEQINWTDRGSAVQNTPNMFHVTSSSSIDFTTADINGYSEFCCQAENSIGVAMKCLNFTETGTPSALSNFQPSAITSNTTTVAWTTLDGPIQYRLNWSRNGVLVNSVNLARDVSMFTINNLQPDTLYKLTISAINTESGLHSSPACITVTTLVLAPGDIRDFNVATDEERQMFRLTWLVPLNSQVDYYIIYINLPGNQTTRNVSGTAASLDVRISVENVAYEFAVQAVNGGGSGPISDFRAVIFCSKEIALVANVDQSREMSTAVNIIWNLTSSFETNGIFITVREGSNSFVTDPIQADSVNQCISNLRPDTFYSVTVLATFNCKNVSAVLDFKTSAGTSDGGFSLEGCIKYVSRVDTPDDESSSGLEIWVIVLIVVIPILAVVVMLSIGIYCACKKRYTLSKDLELPTVNNATLYQRQQQQQQPHLRNNSTSSYTTATTVTSSGSVTPTRSALSYGSRPGRPNWNQPVDVSRIDEQSTGTSV